MNFMNLIWNQMVNANQIFENRMTPFMEITYRHLNTNRTIKAHQISIKNLTKL